MFHEDETAERLAHFFSKRMRAQMHGETTVAGDGDLEDTVHRDQQSYYVPNVPRSTSTPLVLHIVHRLFVQICI